MDITIRLDGELLRQAWLLLRVFQDDLRQRGWSDEITMAHFIQIIVERGIEDRSRHTRSAEE